MITVGCKEPEIRLDTSDENIIEKFTLHTLVFEMFIVNISKSNLFTTKRNKM